MPALKHMGKLMPRQMPVSRRQGGLLSMIWVFSHLAAVKHLAPASYIERLIVRHDLIQRAQQFHLRPFNGHHCQVPVVVMHGDSTPEIKDWLPFARVLLKGWLEGNQGADREIFACPEIGPVPGGYNLSSGPSSWKQAKMLRSEIERIWHALMAELSLRDRRLRP